VSPDSDLTWLRGCWRGEDDGAVTVERWRPHHHEGLVGENRTTKNGKLVHSERLKIERAANGITLTAFPTGQAHAIFTAVEAAERRIVFENLDHDFPQRIIYWSEADDTLTARIEGSEDGKDKSSEWTWARASGPACNLEP
jgi:hypothetical protein